MYISNIFQAQPFTSIKEVMQKFMSTCQVQIFYQHPNEQSLGYGSGYLISDNLILTPAHNVYDKSSKLYHQNIQISFPVGSNQRFSCDCKNIYVSQRFKQEKNERHLLYDYALLKLENFFVDVQLQSCKFGSNMIEIYNKIKELNLRQKVEQLKLNNINKDKQIKDLKVIIEKMKIEIQHLNKVIQLNDSFTSCKSQQSQQLQKPKNTEFYLTQFISNSLKFQKNIIKNFSRKDKQNIQKQTIIGLKPINRSIQFKVFNYGGIYSLVFGIIPQRNIEHIYDQSSQNVSTIQLRCDPRPNDLDGCIYVNREKKTEFQPQLFISTNSVLRMKIQAQHIYFFIDNKEVFEININQQFQKENIYPFVTSNCSGDEIQIIYND